MFRFALILSFLIASTSVFANSGEALSFGVDAGRRGLTELVADPPMPLFKNKKGDYKWTIQPAFVKVKTDPDEPTIVRLDGTTHTEVSDFDGYGFSAGYSNAWKDKWAFFTWLNFLKLEGSHNSDPISDTSKPVARVSNMKTMNINLSFGLSYEFLQTIPSFQCRSSLAQAFPWLIVMVAWSLLMELVALRLFPARRVCRKL